MTDLGWMGTTGQLDSRNDFLKEMVSNQLIRGEALKALNPSQLLTMVKCCINPSFVYMSRVAGYTTSRDALLIADEGVTEAINVMLKITHQDPIQQERALLFRSVPIDPPTPSYLPNAATSPILPPNAAGECSNEPPPSLLGRFTCAACVTAIDTPANLMRHLNSQHRHESTAQAKERCWPAPCTPPELDLRRCPNCHKFFNGSAGLNRHRGAGGSCHPAESGAGPFQPELVASPLATSPPPSIPLSPIPSYLS